MKPTPYQLLIIEFFRAGFIAPVIGSVTFPSFKDMHNRRVTDCTLSRLSDQKELMIITTYHKQYHEKMFVVHKDSTFPQEATSAMPMQTTSTILDYRQTKLTGTWLRRPLRP